MSPNPVPTPPTSRRQVLCGLAVALAVPAGVAGLAACSSPDGGGEGSPPPAPPGGTPLSQVPVGGGVVVEAASGPVVISQPTAGTVRAFSAVCPHQGATVNPPQAGTIVCPRHGSRFDPATGALQKGPAQTGLPEVPSRVENGNVVLS